MNEKTRDSRLNHSERQRFTLILFLILAALLGTPASFALPWEKEPIMIPFRGTEAAVKLPATGKEGYVSALVYMKRKEFAKAETALLEFKQQQKKPSAELWLALAVCLEAQGPKRFEEARDCYLKAETAAKSGVKSFLGGAIREECDAGNKRLDAREKFSGKAK